MNHLYINLLAILEFYMHQEASKGKYLKWTGHKINIADFKQNIDGFLVI